MKFKFKIQQYQTDAVNAVCDVFDGQPSIRSISSTFDKGNAVKSSNSMTLSTNYGDKYNYDIEINARTDNDDILGYSNSNLMISDDVLLSNIKSIQEKANLNVSDVLSKKLGKIQLDVEMETGTGKTYVYIKTMFELNKRYGFKKFIVVVPSIAIREGVKKTFEMTVDHFMETYGKKARYFVYNSKKLDDLNTFSTNADLNVMIINTQAFNARGADVRRIHEELDEFQSRKPIDVISANRPILILDEPQKMGGKATQESLQKFNPLFCLYYSATHKEHHNMVYVLDALEAYKQKLVKKIVVKGIKIDNLKGTNSYVYLDGIDVSTTHAPVARMEIEINYPKSQKINRETKNFDVGDDLYETSNHLEEYSNQFVVNEIDPKNNKVSFLNGLSIGIGEVIGDISEDSLRRIQIRETIKAHFEREKELFHKGIKVLSLFFIDEVNKYREYDENGHQVTGLYGRMFEEEYTKLYKDYYKPLEDKEYAEYLARFNAHDVHKGYFSIDKKGHMVDSKVGRGSDVSDDVSAYDLIMKDKERLLSFDEPTRFIFSHSALREGWDNPNIFQICTLRHTDSDIKRRQEVGRGLRICVNSLGDRMDSSVPGIDFFDINRLTVVANESYEEFVAGLQTELSQDIYHRPSRFNVDFLIGRSIVVNGNAVKIDGPQARKIYQYFVKNDFLNENDRPNQHYKDMVKSNALPPMPAEIEPLANDVHKLAQSVYNPDVLKDIVGNDNQAKTRGNPLNENFKKKEFQELWKLINHQYAYTVDFDSNELIKKCIEEIDKSLSVTVLLYEVTTGEQKDEISQEQIENKESFHNETASSGSLNVADDSSVKYDLLGKIKENTNLTRRTIAKILKGISDEKFCMYRANPEDFINKVSKIIKEQLSTVIVEHVSYNELDQTFDSNIFTESKKSSDFNDAYQAIKNIQDYVFCDGISKTDSVEIRFAHDLDTHDNVVVYAKLPKGFYIPTPMGRYSPDWAIAFKEGTVKHVYFVAETKGSMDSMQLRGIERAKTDCAKKLFEKISNGKVEYGIVKSYKDLMNKVMV